MAAAPILRALSSYPTHTLLDSQWDAVYLVIRRLGFIPPEFERGTTRTGTSNEGRSATRPHAD